MENAKGKYTQEVPSHLTRDEKDLLLKDLCARLPFNVRMYDIDVTLPKIDLWLRGLTYEGSVMVGDDGRGLACSSVGAYLPYLFPLSSMTEEQYNEMQTISGKDCMEHMEIEKEWRNNSPFTHLPLYQHRVIEFFHKYHFDYRGLIPMGLAIDATGKNIY